MRPRYNSIVNHRLSIISIKYLQKNSYKEKGKKNWREKINKRINRSVPFIWRNRISRQEGNLHLSITSQMMIDALALVGQEKDQEKHGFPSFVFSDGSSLGHTLFQISWINHGFPFVGRLWTREWWFSRRALWFSEVHSPVYGSQCLL